MGKIYFSAPHLCVKRGNAFNKAFRMDANGIPASSRSGRKRKSISSATVRQKTRRNRPGKTRREISGNRFANMAIYHPAIKKEAGFFPPPAKNNNDLRGSGASAAHHQGSQTNQAEGCRSRFRNGSRRNGAKVGFLGSVSPQRGIIYDEVLDVIRAIGE